MVSVPMTLSGGGPGFLGHCIFVKSSMSKTVQDRAIVFIEHKQQIIYDLFNGLNSSDLE